MLETLGLITLQESDSILEYNIEYDSWNDTNVYESTSGTWTTSGSSVNLVGVGTAATTELTALDIIAIEYETAIVSTITDDTNIILDKAINTESASELVIITADQRIEIEAMWLKKKKSLLTAYGLIETYCNLPTEITDNLKKAQAFLAANLYISNGSSTTGSNPPNLKRYKVGDMEYEYNTTAPSGNTSLEVFPKQVYELLKPYIKSLKSFAVVYTSAK